MTVVLKVGGRVIEEEAAFTALAHDLTVAAVERLVVVHGGGAAVSRLSRRMGVAPRFVDGVRQTGAEEIDIVDMVLAGAVNTAFVRRVRRLRPVGITGNDGNLVTAARTGPRSHTGTVVSVDPAIIIALWAAGFTPIVASVAQDESGTALNVNADQIADAIARALRADLLCYLSDVDGVLVDGEPIRCLSTDDVEHRIADGTVHGGMAAKLRSARDAIAAGVTRVTIGRVRAAGDVVDLLHHRRGTRIQLGACKENET